MQLYRFLTNDLCVVVVVVIRSCLYVYGTDDRYNRVATLIAI